MRKLLPQGNRLRKRESFHGLGMAAYSVTLSPVSTLAERLSEVMALRGLNPSSWAQKADVPRATVRLAIKDGRDSMESRTLAKLAKAAEVSFEWLATGSFAADLPEDTLYPSRRRAIAAAYVLGYSKAIIAAVSSVADLERDPGADYWVALLLAKKLENVQAPAALSAPADEHSR
jgi:predicted transcriptional regulator